MVLVDARDLEMYADPVVVTSDVISIVLSVDVSSVVRD